MDWPLALVITTAIIATAAVTVVAILVAFARKPRP